MRYVLYQRTNLSAAHDGSARVEVERLTHCCAAPQSQVKEVEREIQRLHERIAAARDDPDKRINRRDLDEALRRLGKSFPKTQLEVSRVMRTFFRLGEEIMRRGRETNQSIAQPGSPREPRSHGRLTRQPGRCTDASSSCVHSYMCACVCVFSM
jgi:hypothetical protein